MFFAKNSIYLSVSVNEQIRYFQGRGMNLLIVSHVKYIHSQTQMGTQFRTRQERRSKSVSALQHDFLTPHPSILSVCSCQQWSSPWFNCCDWSLQSDSFSRFQHTGFLHQQRREICTLYSKLVFLKPLKKIGEMVLCLLHLDRQKGHHQ